MPRNGPRVAAWPSIGLVAALLLTVGDGAAGAVAADAAAPDGAPPVQSAQNREEAPPAAARPVRVFTDGQGRTCHVYAHEVSIDRMPQTAYAVICQLANGRWVLVR